jgi:hypothetical protein
VNFDASRRIRAGDPPGRAIATAHGATITARPGPGGGLSVSVVFPQPASGRQGDRRTAGIELAAP